MNNIKKHWLVSIMVVLSLGCIFYFGFRFVSNQKQLEYIQQQRINYCNSNAVVNEDIEMCQNYLQTVGESQKIQIDFYSMMTDILIFDMSFINIIAFLILIIPTLTEICKILKNNFPTSFCIRSSYKSFIIIFLSRAYRYVWLLPVIASVLILTCIFSTTLDPTYAITYGSSMWKSSIIYHPIMFIILYLVNIIMYSFTFINLALVIVRKQHSYVKAVILSFIAYIGIEFFLEVVVNVIICQIIFKSDIGHIFNIVNLFNFSDVYGIFSLILFTFVICILSFVAVYFSYKNKESLIIECEKNS